MSDSDAIRLRFEVESEHLWGEVTTWDPPARLGYRWHLGREPSAATDVLIT